MGLGQAACNSENACSFPAFAFFWDAWLDPLCSLVVGAGSLALPFSA